MAELADEFRPQGRHNECAQSLLPNSTECLLITLFIQNKSFQCCWCLEDPHNGRKEGSSVSLRCSASPWQGPARCPAASWAIPEAGTGEDSGSQLLLLSVYCLPDTVLVPHGAITIYNRCWTEIQRSEVIRQNDTDQCSVSSIQALIITNLKNIFQFPKLSSGIVFSSTLREGPRRLRDNPRLYDSQGDRVRRPPSLTNHWRQEN